MQSKWLWLLRIPDWWLPEESARFLCSFSYIFLFHSFQWLSLNNKMKIIFSSSVASYEISEMNCHSWHERAQLSNSISDRRVVGTQTRVPFHLSSYWPLCLCPMTHCWHNYMHVEPSTNTHTSTQWNALARILADDDDDKIFRWWIIFVRLAIMIGHGVIWRATVSTSLR